MNLLVPGTGLIALGRVWLGIALAVWFALGGELAAFGLLIAPLSLPKGMAWCGAALAGLAWSVGQGLLWGRIRFLRDPELPRELKALCELAEAELTQGNLSAARSALEAAMLIDDADLATHVLWARLMTHRGKPSQVRRAWLAAQQLDTQSTYSSEIRQALEQLQGNA